MTMMLLLLMMMMVCDGGVMMMMMMMPFASALCQRKWRSCYGSMS